MRTGGERKRERLHIFSSPTIVVGLKLGKPRREDWLRGL
jgi:hypothetical protein